MRRWYFLAVTREWLDWYKGYDGDGALAKRLRLVQSLVCQALSECRTGPISVISVCAGDGRDLLGVLPTHPRCSDVKATLVEFEPELIQRGRQLARRSRLTGIDFRLSDAAKMDSYVGAVPADLVLVCGVFGNISDTDVHDTIAHLPELCAPQAAVIWTRGTFEPDLTPTLRGWFTNSGFVELSFTAIAETTASVGCHRLAVSPRDFNPDRSLFTFLPNGERDLRYGAHVLRDAI
jgi:hypothetical protein